MRFVRPLAAVLAIGLTAEQLSSAMVSSESQILRIRRDLSIVLDDGM